MNLLQVIINVLNGVIRQLSDIMIFIVNLLPSSPFTWDLGALGEYWNTVNYFVPFQGMFTIATTYISACLIYYLLRWILRLVRYIQ